MATALLAIILSDLPEFERLPGVASARVAAECADLKLTIIHVRDWHCIDRQAFTLDVHDASPSTHAIAPSAPRLNDHAANPRFRAKKDQFNEHRLTDQHRTC